MSKDRLSNQFEQKLQSSVDGLQAQLNDLRSNGPQFIGGASIEYFRSEGANQFDWTGTLNTSLTAGFGSRTFLITATASTMPVFYGVITHSLFADTPISLYDGADFMADTVSGAFAYTTFYVDAPNSSITPTVKQWFLSISGNNTRTLWLKFHVYGFDNASIAVTVLT